MTEAEEQREIAAWFTTTWPQYAHTLRVSMAGLPRHGKKGAIQWGMMKGQGVQEGESDIAIVLARGNFGALLVEHKRAQGDRNATVEQQRYLSLHAACGNMIAVTVGVDEAKAVISQYMALPRGRFDSIIGTA